MVNSAVRLCGALTHLQHQTTVNVKRKSLQIIRNDMLISNVLMMDFLMKVSCSTKICVTSAVRD